MLYTFHGRFWRQKDLAAGVYRMRVKLKWPRADALPGLETHAKILKEEIQAVVSKILKSIYIAKCNG